MKIVRIIIVGVVVALLVGVFLIIRGSKHSTPPVSKADIITTTNEKVLTFQGEDGKTVFDLVKAKYPVEVDTEKDHFVIKSLNGMADSATARWIYSINGKEQDIRPDRYFTNSTDTIKWEYTVQ